MNVPLIIIALSIGILFGSDVTGIIYFDDAVLARRLASIALIFVLFAGGFGTKSHHLKAVIKPTILLATIGVLITANVTAVIFCIVTGWSLERAILLGAILSSTDAAAVFSILRTRSLRKDVSSISEIESAANDPVAIISTTIIIQLIVGTGIGTVSTIFLFIWQMAGGIGIGLLVGFIGAYFYKKIKSLDIGYFYIFLIGMILLSYGLSELCAASGLLATFFAGFVLGNKELPYKKGISSFTETLSFMANVGLFVLLGLLVFPKSFSAIWLLGIVIFLIITFISRPITVFLCTFFTDLSIREKLFLSWSGIRGAVPIVLATYPAAAGIDDDHQIFNIVFFAVTLSILVQGTTIGKFADLLKLSVKDKRRQSHTMELVTIHDTNYELAELFIDNDIYRGSCRISDLDLPHGTTITMITRDNEIIAPSGSTEILPGDTLSVLLERDKVEEITKNVFSLFSTKKRPDD